MKNIEYTVSFELISRKGIKEHKTEIVPSYNTNANDFARRKIENKYRGQGYKVQILSITSESLDG